MNHGKVVSRVTSLCSFRMVQLIFFRVVSSLSQDFTVLAGSQYCPKWWHDLRGLQCGLNEILLALFWLLLVCVCATKCWLTGVMRFFFSCFVFVFISRVFFFFFFFFLGSSILYLTLLLFFFLRIWALIDC